MITVAEVEWIFDSIDNDSYYNSNTEEARINLELSDCTSHNQWVIPPAPVTKFMEAHTWWWNDCNTAIVDVACLSLCKSNYDEIICRELQDP